MDSDSDSVKAVYLQRRCDMEQMSQITDRFAIYNSLTKLVDVAVELQVNCEHNGPRDLQQQGVITPQGPQI
jgi:hypothetical protein